MVSSFFSNRNRLWNEWFYDLGQITSPLFCASTFLSNKKDVLLNQSCQCINPHVSPLSHFLSYSSCQLPNRHTGIWLDTHGRREKEREAPVLCFLEITTAATGAWAPLGEVEDEHPGGQQLPGGKPAASEGKDLILPLFPPG